MADTIKPGRNEATVAGDSAQYDLEQLPKFEFKQLAKSPKVVAAENRHGEGETEIKQVKSFGESTVVVLNGEMQIFDSKGRKEENFTSLGLTKKTFDLKNELNKRSLAYLVSGGGESDSQNHTVKDLPAQYRELLLRAMEKQHESWLRINDANEALSYDISGSLVSVVEDGKYIIVSDEKKPDYITYVTKNEAGIAQPPRNWQRFDKFNMNTTPKAVKDATQRVLEKGSKILDINSDYSVQISDGGISILKGTGDKTNMNPVFSDKVEGVHNNLCVDPRAAGVVYYCRSNNPADLVRLDTRKDPGQWAPEAAQFPQTYASVENLQLDPGGNFFIFYCGKDLVVLAKDTLQEIKRVPDLSYVNFDNTGKIRAIDKDGCLVVLETNLDAIAESMEGQKAARLVSAVDLGDIFAGPAGAKVKTAAEGGGLERLNPARDKYVLDLKKYIDQAQGLDDIMALRQRFPVLASKLQSQGLRTEEADYIIGALEEELRQTELPLATDEVVKTIQQVRDRLAGGVSLASVLEMGDELDRLNSIKTLVDKALSEDLRLVRVEVETAAKDIFEREGDQIKEQISGIVEGSRQKLEGFTNKNEFDDWEEYEYPALKTQLNSLLQQCPLQATEAFNFIKNTTRALVALDTEYREKFERQYAEVRQKAVDRYGDIISTLKEDATQLVERLAAKGFKDRAKAEAYLASSPAKQALLAEIAALAGKFPAEAEELRRSLDVKINNELFAIERGAAITVADTGERMVTFGKVVFPEWAAKVKEKDERKVELSFKLQEKHAGAGVRADLVLNIANPDGSEEQVRLFEGMPGEDEMRVGVKTYRGTDIPPTLLEGDKMADLRAQFKQIKADYSDWQKGEKSPLQQEYARRREELHTIAARRSKKGTPEELAAVKEEYSLKLKEFGAFCAQHHISALRRADKVRGTPALEHENGIGEIPEWKNHWVRDPETERYLEVMAEEAKGQLRRKEGVINLTGHAGTGKDVLVNMFCALTKRPKFSFDASKWTTEMDLAEDVMLATEDGATTSVRLPSAFLHGMQTPGAVVYVNEFNAMPQQAQMFLHAPYDEKRTMTVKTRGGKAMPVAEGVIFMSSENPDYPGTFEPQMATESRRIPINVNYPPLTREPRAGDTNPNKPYNVSEALRIAREVKSLRGLTSEQSMERNEFVRMWDNYVNGEKNGGIKPGPEQEFDLNTIMALVQFSDKIRKIFISTYEKKRGTVGAVKAKQPLTGRELRRCADVLSQIPAAEKNKGGEEEMARALLKRYYLSHVSNTEEHEKIETEMAGWSSSKRVGV